MANYPTIAPHQYPPVAQYPPPVAQYPPVGQYPDNTQYHNSSTPVIGAPVPQYGYGASFPPPNSGAWTTGLCDCCDDCSSCCCGCWCPCVLVGRSVEIIDQGATSCCEAGSIFTLLHALFGLGCLYTCIYRGRLRQMHGLPSSCGDFCTDCCCLSCSICQVYRELENRNMKAVPRVGAHYPTAPSTQYMSR